MALTVQLQLNPRAKPFVPTVKANKLLQRRRGKQEEGGAPVSKRQTQLGRVRWASRCVEGEPNPPRETKNSGANRGRNCRTQVYKEKKLQQKKMYMPEKRGVEGEWDGAQHDDKGATTVTELAEGNSSSLPITCGRWLWIKSTAWAERRRYSSCTKRMVATSSVCRKLYRRSGQSALLQAGYVVYCSGESGGDGRGRAKVELDWMFARVSPVPKHDRRSSSATGY